MIQNKLKKQTWPAPKIFLGVVSVCFLVIVAQLVYVTMFPTLYGENMEEFAKKRNTYSTTLYAKRGTIFDAEGNKLALNVSSYTVIAYLNERRTGKSTTPLHVVDKEKTAKALAPLINMSEEYIMSLLNKDVYQVELGPGGRNVTELVKRQIEELNLPGIDFVESFKRYYPNGNFASYVLGYAKKDVDKVTKKEEIVGELGIESKYNDLLTGKNGSLTYQKDRYGYKIPNTKENRIEAEDGSDIYLTIDSNIQRFVESAMQNMKAYEPEWANVTVMNAKTGYILGTASIPSFDPNLRDITNYQSPLVTYPFEPGSTMKTFAYLCAIDSGKYDGNMTLQSGSLKIGDDEVRDWNRTGWGTITLDQGFLYSSNVAASTLVQRVINKSELRDCYEKFGFAQKTDIELSNEATGALNFTYPIEVATAAFGQGITSTVMQQLQGLTIVANEGKMVKPHIVEKIVNEKKDEIIYEGKVEKSNQLVKKSSVEYMKDLLDKVVNGDDYNRTGVQFAMPGYDLIGKTGTAQISGPGSGYLDGFNDYIYSFAGMYPKNDPEIIIYAAIKKPNSASNKGVVNAVKEIVTNTTKYLNIFNTIDNNSSVTKVPIKSYINKNTDSVIEELANSNVNVIRIGNGNKVIDQFPKKGTTILNYDRVYLVTNNTEVRLPNMVGWSSKDIKNFAKLTNLNYTINGNGYVTSQSHAEGTVLNNELNVTFELADKIKEE